MANPELEQEKVALNLQVMQPVREGVPDTRYVFSLLSIFCREYCYIELI
jgi:hypothetical protein